MRSAAAPTATVLMIVTLVFAPAVKHNRTYQDLVGKDTTEVAIPCVPDRACPHHSIAVNRMNAPDSSKASFDAAVAKSVQKAIDEFLANRR